MVEVYSNLVLGNGANSMISELLSMMTMWRYLCHFLDEGQFEQISKQERMETLDLNNLTQYFNK